MRIENIKYIFEVVKAGSISRASKNLWMGQTTLSSIVRSVEEELGIQLFIRTPKGVRLTPKGEKAYEIMKIILDNYGSLSTLSTTSPIIEASCNICCYPDMCSHLSVSLMNMKMGRYNDVALTILPVPSKNIISSVTNGEGALGVGAVVSSEFDSLKRLAVSQKVNLETLYTDCFSLFVNQNSKNAGRRSIGIGDISDIDIVSAPSFPELSISLLPLVGRHVRSHSVLSDLAAVKQTVANCNVAAILPTLALRDDIYVKGGLIHPVALNGFNVNLLNFVVYPGNVLMSPFESEILDEIRVFYSSFCEEENALCE